MEPVAVLAITSLLGPSVIAGVALYVDLRYGFNQDEQKEDIMVSQKFKSKASDSTLRVGVAPEHVAIDHCGEWDSKCLDLSFEDARTLGEWLLENTPEPPKPKTTAEQIRALDFGTVFDISGAPRLTFVKLQGEQYWASDEGGRLLELPETRWTERYDTVTPREV